MEFSLIVCTFQRPKSLETLLHSVKTQSLLPQQIIIVDGSLDSNTENVLKTISLPHLEYYRVGQSERGLTRQRNIGVQKVNKESQIIFFLDDDTKLDVEYFKEILTTYKTLPEAVGVAGYIINENNWREIKPQYNIKNGDFIYDGWVRTEGLRFSMRRKLGLAPNVPPGYMPNFSHGYSAGFLPPTGKTYEVEMLMGGISSYKREIFDKTNFSFYFEGYGLYEDADFSMRVSKLGKLFVNTAALVEHHHAEEGRPNMFKYGKMVVRNGWYVWRIRHPKPTFIAKIKWHSTTLLLTVIRFGNVFSNESRGNAFWEGLGRAVGWFSLLQKKPMK